MSKHFNQMMMSRRVSALVHLL